MTNGKWISLLAVAAFAGCMTTVQLAPSESDAAAKRFVPPDGKANLYVARSNASEGERALFGVSIDGKAVGPIAAGTFYLVVLDPGTHSVAATSNENTSKASFDAQAGKNYFFEVTATAGTATPRVSLGLVLLEPMGKIMVQQDKRALSVNE